jgi:hypothetical protein
MFRSELLLLSSTLKIKAADSFETSLNIYRVHGVTRHRTEIYAVTAVRTLNIIYLRVFSSGVKRHVLR